MIKDNQDSELKQKIHAIIQKSLKFWHESNNSQSRKYALLAKELARKNELLEFEGDSLNILGLIEVMENNYSQALEYFLTALKKFQQANYTLAIANIYNNIGLVYLKMKNKEKARDFFEKAIENQKDDGRKHDVKFTKEVFKLNLGIVELQLKNYETPLKYFNEALTESRELKKENSESVCLVNIGEVYQMLQNYDISINYYQQALNIAEKSKNKKVMIPLLNDIGVVYKQLGKYKDSLETHNKALTLSQDIGERIFERESLLCLSQTYEAMNEITTAFDFYKQQSTLKDEIYSEDLNRKIASIQTFHEMETKELKAKQLVEKASKLASIGVMAGGITHEINQPLNAIKISADSILFWNKANPDNLPGLFVDELENISQAVDRIENIITHMRSFWVNSEDHKPEIIELNSAIKNALSLVDRQLFSHGIEQEFKFCDKELMIPCSSIQLEQIVINLTMNAMHALDEIEKDSKVITFQTKLEKQMVRFEVIDNGPGLAETGEKVFDPFFSTKKPGEGMGLGLAIVKNIIETLGGKITARNLPDKGACFTMYLPIRLENVK